MNDNTYIISNIRAARVNLLMNDFAAGLPSPLSFLGLGDALVRRLELEPWSAKVLPVLHDLYVSEGRTKAEMEIKGGSFSPIEIMEDLTGVVELSVVIQLPKAVGASALAAAFKGCRIAGGVVQNQDPSVRSVTPDGSLFTSLRRGYALLPPMKSEMHQITMGDEDGLRRIAETLYPLERAEGAGWLVPVSAGYRLLEDPNSAPKRIRTRNPDVPHVFAEPVLGISELVSVRNQRLTSLSSEELSELFWRWDVRGDFALGHPAFHSTTTKEVNENV